MHTLTPEQATEFDTPALREFALAYLEFQTSSPYTTSKKFFKYFEPLKPDELTDHDILFGRDRDQAYAELLMCFNICKANNEFDRFFDEKHKIYFKFKTIPTLIIFKKWLTA